MSEAAAARKRPRPKSADAESMARILVMNRRRHGRLKVAGVAAMTRPGNPIAVWVVQNLSEGGASVTGDPLPIPGQRIRLALYLAGKPPLWLMAKVLRRQIAGPGGKCALEFEGVSAEQRSAILDALQSEGSRPKGAPAANILVVGRAPQTLEALARELITLGHAPRVVGSPLEAAAWLQRESDVTTVMVEDKLIELDGWNFMKFVRDTWPNLKRVAVASAIHSFRLNIALRSGLADAVVERPFAAVLLARKLGLPTKRR